MPRMLVAASLLALAVTSLLAARLASMPSTRSASPSARASGHPPASDDTASYYPALPPGCFPIPLPPPTGDVVVVADAASLARAVRELESGTTILIQPGTYDLPNTLHVRGGVRDVAIRGRSHNRDDVVLRGRGMRQANYGNVPHGILISDAKDVLITDLTISDVYYHAVQIQGEAGAEGVTLYNLHLVDAGEQLVKGSSGGPPGPYADDGTVACSLIEYTDRARDDYTNGVDVLAGSGWVIRDNVFRRIRAPAGQLAGPAVLMWRNSIDTVVERNRFIECDRAIALGLSAPDPGTARDGEAVYDHQGGVIRNNFVYRAAGAATGDVGITVNHARDVQILNNTVIQNDTFPYGTIEYRFNSTTADIRYNLTDGPIWRRNGAVGSVEGNITSALPGWFADPSVGDLHLRASASAAIDAAGTHRDVPDDIDEGVRPHGEAPDVGADELGAPSDAAATATHEAWRTPTRSITATPTSTAEAPTPITDTPTPSATATRDQAVTPSAMPTANRTPNGGARLYLTLAFTGARY